ncbi:DUF2637 domain-containing protein [Streptomyces sp. C1-2]|uniref:DUF2637 domain-containing protein n=1 Tax=Streptomyces sp. C1-2 TaxID=2720022 RepID=UPI0014327D79|nr:DUF2637 domain-containing protein [Streptomyces sp. C1-2]NJP73914.1 DUF2637 domain-containing protein [Streptomyces sp. C1-2]
MSRWNEQSEGRLPNRVQLSRAQRGLVSVVVIGAVAIAAIGFIGSYGAVRTLAQRKGFGDFAVVFPIGIDAGICVLLALDLLLTWLRIPFPMLRQTAWLMTVATIAFNGAAAWPDPIGVGMHAVIPLLFVVAVEAARHAVGRIADITADRHMEGVRWVRWVLSPLPTFLLWRKMILWEIRRYDDVISAEQDRLVYQAELRMRHGWAWRWKAPVEKLLPLRIARFGVPLKPGGVLSGAGLGPGAGRELGAADDAEEDLLAAEEAPAQKPARRSSETSAATVAAEAVADEPSRKAARGDSADAVPADRGQGAGQARDPDPVPEDDTASRGRDNPITADEQAPEPGDGTPAPETDGAADATEASSTAPDEGAPSPVPAEEHEVVLAGLSSNAAAVRYAIEVLDSTHTPEIVEWLKQRGRPVNRGQAHRIIETEAGKRRKSHMRMVKTGAR